MDQLVVVRPGGGQFGFVINGVLRKTGTSDVGLIYAQDF